MHSKQNILFISDLHLGAGRANDFHATYQLHRLLDYAAENADELVIVGDLLELLQSDFMEIYIQNHALFIHLFELARKIPVTYMIGNHDALMVLDYNPGGRSRFLGSEVLVTPEYENRELKILATHGHQYDPLNCSDDILNFSTRNGVVGDRVVSAFGWLERNVHREIDRVAERIYRNSKIWLRKISHRTKKQYAQLVPPTHPAYRQLGGDYSEYERGALDILRSERYTLAIFGHTHIAQLQRFTQKKNNVDGLYANAGSWVGNDSEKDPPIFIDVDANFVRLIDAETFEELDIAERKIKKHFLTPNKSKLFSRATI